MADASTTLDEVTVTAPAPKQPSRTPRRPEDDDLVINTGVQLLGGWQQFRMTRGIEKMPSDVEIRLTERYPGQMGKSIVEPGAPCTVTLGGDLILTGFIDRYYPTIDAHDHQAMI